MCRPYRPEGLFIPFHRWKGGKTANGSKRDQFPSYTPPVLRGRFLAKVIPFYAMGCSPKPFYAPGGIPAGGFLCSGGQGLIFIKVHFLHFTGCGPNPSYASGGVSCRRRFVPCGRAYEHSIPVVRPGRSVGQFYLITFQQWKVVKDCRGPPTGWFFPLLRFVTEPTFLHFCPDKSGKTRRGKPPDPP